MRGRFDLAEAAKHRGVLGKLLLRQGCIPQNRHEQVVEVVGDAPGQNTQALQLLRLQHLRFEPAAAFLRGLPLGDLLEQGFVGVP